MKAPPISCLVYFAAVITAFSQSTWVHFGTNGNLTYHADDLNNRILDFSYAGYHGGGEALPDVPVKRTVTPVSGDDTSTIQSAINAVNAMTPDSNGFRGAVLLKAGTYSISGRLNLSTSGVVLRGEGTSTVLSVTKASSTVINVDGSGSRTLSGTAVNITNSYVPLNARTFNISSTSGFAVGDRVVVQRAQTQSWIDAIGMNGIWGPNSGLYFERQITAISGSQVTIDIPLANPIEQKWVTGKMQKYSDSGRVQECGVENMRILCANVDAVGSSRAVSFGWAKNCWSHDVLVDGFNNGYTCSPDSKWITVADCEYTNGQGGGSARPGCYNTEGQMCLYLRCTTSGVHPDGDGSWIVTTQANTAGPNAFVDLASNSDHTAAQPHARWAAGVLIDSMGGSSLQGVSIQNLGTGGNGHGWAAGYSVVYNCTPNSFSVEEPTADHHYNWVIGGKGTVNPPRSMPNTEGGTTDHVGTILTPASLYLEQLKERLGGDAVENIGYELFTISATPSTASITAGDSATVTVSVTDPNDLQNITSLSVSGLPAGASAQFSPSSITSDGSSTLTVSTSSSTPAGTYSLTVKGTVNGLVHSDTVSLTVTSSNVVIEAEDASPVGTGAATQITADTLASGGEWVSLLADAANDFVEYTVPNVPAGTYAVTLRYKLNNNRGTMQVSVNGSNVGGVLDQYAASSSYAETTLGNCSVTSTGNVTVRMTVIDKNAASSGFTISADKFTFTVVPPTNGGVFEAESLAVENSSGDLIHASTESSASGGATLIQDTDAVGDFMTLRIPNIAAGTYTLKVRFKLNTTRGIVQTQVGKIGGSLGNIGPEIDLFASAISYQEFTLGSWTVGSSDKQISFRIAGQNGGSSGFTQAVDSITLVPQ